LVQKLLALVICAAALRVVAAHATPNDATPGTEPPAATAPGTDLSQHAGTLSDKLNDANGVIHPEGDVDPKMRKKAPSVGTMPVIQPPGSPGGSTDVQPK
jgi:hypothetical protein